VDETLLMDLGKTTLLTALIIVAPALLVGMVIGLVVSFFQTVTSLQEQTLAIVPKMLAVVATLLLLMPWILGVLREFTTSLLLNLAEFGKG
jgi:flagellar biosynthetic protein FliQ